MSIVVKTIVLSHPKFHENYLRFIVNIFLENDYPIKFIFDMINSRLKSLLKRKTRRQANPDTINNEEKTMWFTIPFLLHLYIRSINKFPPFLIKN